MKLNIYLKSMLSVLLLTSVTGNIIGSNFTKKLQGHVEDALITILSVDTDSGYRGKIKHGISAGISGIASLGLTWASLKHLTENLSRSTSGNFSTKDKIMHTFIAGLGLNYARKLGLYSLKSFRNLVATQHEEDDSEEIENN